MIASAPLLRADWAKRSSGLDDLVALLRGVLSNLSDQAQHHEAIGTIGQAMLHLPTHGGHVE
jgi:hypothetical protein